jgi:hypothetical protein
MKNARASRGWVFQLLTGSLQAFFAGQSPAQAVFPLETERVVIQFHSYDVYFPCYLILKPVPYLHLKHALLS